MVSAAKSYFLPQLLIPFNRRRLLADYHDYLIYARPWTQEIISRHVRPWLRPLLPAIPKYALWHSTSPFVKYLPLDDRIPVVLTIHDLNFLREKSLKKCARKLRFLQRLVERAAAITTISNFVADELRKHLDLCEKPLYVVYNGLIAEEYRDAAKPGYMDNRPFLFTIGNVMAKKNFHVLVRLLPALPQYRLVIAGYNRTAYAKQILKLAAQIGVSDRVVMPGAISDATRYWMYQNCSAFLFPSITEGFGLPVIEAMRLGKPVFLSNATSLPEIGGPLAFYWRSFSVEHMLEVFHKGMAAYFADATYPARLTARAQQFSWEQTAAEYVTIYRKVLEETHTMPLRLRAA